MEDLLQYLLKMPLKKQLSFCIATVLPSNNSTILISSLPLLPLTPGLICSVQFQFGKNNIVMKGIII